MRDIICTTAVTCWLKFMLSALFVPVVIGFADALAPLTFDDDYLRSA